MAAGENFLRGEYYYDEKAGDYVQIQRGFADPAGAGDNQLVAAPAAGFKVRLLAAMWLNNAVTAQNVRFRSGTNSKSAIYNNPAPLAGQNVNQPMSLPFNQAGWLDCNAAEALNLNLSAATAVGITFVYVVIKA